MNDTVKIVLEACSRESFQNLPFPQVIGRLVEAGVERYHADLSRHEKIFYLPNGDSHAVSEAALMLDAGLGHHLVAENFQPEAVRAAVQAIQQRQIGYAEFLRRLLDAGTVAYFVYLTGKRVDYAGRKGEVYTEWFPGAKPE